MISKMLKKHLTKSSSDCEVDDTFFAIFDFHQLFDLHVAENVEKAKERDL